MGRLSVVGRWRSMRARNYVLSAGWLRRLSGGAASLLRIDETNLSGAPKPRASLKNRRYFKQKLIKRS
jgi:hypothetical protein